MTRARGKEHPSALRPVVYLVLRRAGAAMVVARGNAHAAAPARNVIPRVHDLVYLDGVDDAVQVYATQTQTSGTLLAGPGTLFSAHRVG